MKRRSNRRVERAGVNASQALFEHCDWLFQDVNLENDFGKDAYVDAPNGDDVSGLCAALQIKSGSSFRRHDNEYAIPIGAHEEVWRGSTLPLMGIVHDPEGGNLFWCNITAFLRDHEPGSIKSIPVRHPLDSGALSGPFLDSIRQLGTMWCLPSPLDLCSESQERQVDAIVGCFAASNLDPRGMILVRRLLLSLNGEPLRAAVSLLAQSERHPTSAKRVRESCRWQITEILHLFSRVTWDEWERGDVGEGVYTLLIRDPQFRFKVRKCLAAAVASRLDDAAWTAAYLLLYWSRDSVRLYEKLICMYPRLRRHPLTSELELNLMESGSSALF